MDDTLRDTLFASNKQFRTPKHLVVDQVFDTSRINHSKCKNSKHVTFILHYLNVPKIEHFF